MRLPWGYKRAFLCCALLFLLGTVLQWLTGPIPPHFLHYPLSAVLALLYTYALVVLQVLSGRFPRLKRLSDPCAATASIVSVVAMSILFGLTPQGEGGTGIAGALGWTQMRSHWAFNLLMLYLMTGIGLSAIAGLRQFRSARPAAVLSHLATYLVLCAAFFGNGDKVETLVTAVRGEVVAVGEDEAGQRVELPFMLRLEDFTIEEYPLAPGPVDTVRTEDGQVMAMPRRYPKRYLSDVTILSAKGEDRVSIAVNHPARVGPWRIYQYGYDMSQGAQSRTSELLCVKDGWYPLIGAGLWMLLGAGVLMFLTAGGRRKKKEVTR